MIKFRIKLAEEFILTEKFISQIIKVAINNFKKNNNSVKSNSAVVLVMKNQIIYTDN